MIGAAHIGDLMFAAGSVRASPAGGVGVSRTMSVLEALASAFPVMVAGTATNSNRWTVARLSPGVHADRRLLTSLLFHQVPVACFRRMADRWKVRLWRVPTGSSGRDPNDRTGW